MAKGFTISIGLSDVAFQATRDIEKYDKEKREAIQGVIQRGTQATLEEALRLAPHGPTGNLKAGITSEFHGGMRASGRVKSTAPHSHLVEFGTGARIVYPVRKKALKFRDGGFARGLISAGVMEGKPFMRPAAEKTKPQIEKEMEEVMNK